MTRSRFVGFRRLLAASFGVFVVGSGVGARVDRASAATAASRDAFDTPFRPCGLPRTFDCSSITVPLDRARPNGERLRLRVGVQRVASAPRGHLLLLAGGPGQPGVLFGDVYVRRFGAAAAGYRIVVIDTRGTGAGALLCPELQILGYSDLTVPPAGAVEACAATLGARRDFFRTDDVVADLDALRGALGAASWTVGGTSYGAYVAARYGLAHPDRTRRLVLGSVVPHKGIDPFLTEPMARVPYVLHDACGDPCPVDPAADTAAVVARGKGVQLLDALTALSVFSPGFERVTAAIHDAAGGDSAALDALLRTSAALLKADAGELSQGLHAAQLCPDTPVPWPPSEANVAVRRQSVATAAQRLAGVDLGPFDIATATGNGFVELCLRWPPSARSPQPSYERAVLRPPTLILAGERDLSTPLAWAQWEARQAADARLVVVPDMGHTIYRDTTGLVRTELQRFLQVR